MSPNMVCQGTNDQRCKVLSVLSAGLMLLVFLDTLVIAVLSGLSFRHYCC